MWGLDISEEMLKHVPAGIHTRAGSMTALPFEDGWFDAAYATESLEHAVEIDVAVGEICRVVKPAAASPSSTRTPSITGNSRPGRERWFDRRSSGAVGALPRSPQPVHFVLGRRRAGRHVHRLAGDEVAAGGPWLLAGRMTCKICKVAMKEMKGHVYHKQRKWKCPICARVKMQKQPRTRLGQPQQDQPCGVIRW